MALQHIKKEQSCRYQKTMKKHWGKKRHGLVMVRLVNQTLADGIGSAPQAEVGARECRRRASVSNIARSNTRESIRDKLARSSRIGQIRYGGGAGFY